MADPDARLDGMQVGARSVWLDVAGCKEQLTQATLSAAAAEKNG